MEEIALTPAEFELFRVLIHQKVGIVMSPAKMQLVHSRLGKRLRHHSLRSYQAYYDMLMAAGADSEEMVAFINCVTTNKTDFFREPHHFQFVTDTFLPELVQKVLRGSMPPKIRVWHAGCSTGEEPYSLAITLQDALRGKNNWDVRQLASDIDTDVLAHAQRGIYDLDRVKPVPDAQLKRYFLRGAGECKDTVKVATALSDQIAFRQINLLSEPWPIRADVRFDMIFCRNVVIYFDKPTQQRLFARFTEYLRPGGYLFMGHSESLLGISNAYESLGSTIHRLPDCAFTDTAVGTRAA